MEYFNYDASQNPEMIKELEERFPLLKFVYEYCVECKHENDINCSIMSIGFRNDINLTKDEVIKFVKEYGFDIKDKSIYDKEKKEFSVYGLEEVYDYEKGDFIFDIAVKEIMSKYYPKDVVRSLIITRSVDIYGDIKDIEEHQKMKQRNIDKLIKEELAYLDFDRLKLIKALAQKLKEDNVKDNFLIFDEEEQAKDNNKEEQSKDNNKEEQSK